MQILILGSVPSQKNSKQIFINKRTNKPFITSSNNVKAWQESALWQLKKYKPLEEYPVEITMVFYHKDNRRKDLDNSCSGVLDILVKAAILKDDSCKFVPSLSLKFGGVSNNPRVEIYISPLH